MEGRIGVPPYQVLAEHPELFPGRVTREDPAAVDTWAGQPGRLAFLDISRINFGSMQASAIDMVAAHAFDTVFGRVEPSLSATWIDEYETVDVPDHSPRNRVGIANRYGAVARWRASATLGWARPSLGFSATARLTAATRDLSVHEGAAARKISSQTLVDLYGWVHFDQLPPEITWLSDVKVTAGVVNLLDKEPQFANMGSSWGYDPTQGELRQRFGYIRLAARF
jgi:iron complex outermembrane receptor protein